MGLILNSFYKKSWSQNRPLKILTHADDDDDYELVQTNETVDAVSSSLI
jgi:hypothetical protein